MSAIAPPGDDGTVKVRWLPETAAEAEARAAAEAAAADAAAEAAAIEAAKPKWV